MSDVDLRFLPWFRRGVATLIQTPDDGNAAARFSASASVELQEVATSVQTSVINAPVTVYGPGDVVGLGETQVLAREPANGTVGFEPNYLPHLDLRAADLPWRYTPAKAAADGKLRPWLVLVALERSETLAVRKTPQASAPSVEAPMAELPDLAESPLWAHVQVSGPFDATPLVEVVRDQPERARARLICPRRLQPQKGYLVCLVPAFEVGRRAGLGQAVTPAEEAALGLQEAWAYDPAAAGGTVTLPVYAHWSFTTAAGGDFESLARALAPFQVSAEAARRPFTVDPDLTAQDEELGLGGALRPIFEPPPPVETPSAAVTGGLTSWLNRSAEVEDTGGNPQVTPPIYGRWQAGVRRVADAGPPWLDELNLDPRYRVAAAAGGDVVQLHQDEFVDQAWEQAGDLHEANELLQRAQLARSVGGELKRRHFEPLPGDLMLQVAGPVQARTKDGAQTLLKTVQQSAVPELGFSGAFRRMSRVRGPHMGRWHGGHLVNAEDLLFEQRLVDQPITPQTTHLIVDAPLAVSGPSNWSWSADGKSLYQTTNIYTPETASGETATSYRGTMYVVADPVARDLKFACKVSSQDNDAVGIVFRYTSDRYHYRFSVDSQRSYRRLVRVYGGVFTTLWEDATAYVPGWPYAFEVTLDGARIVIKAGSWNASETVVDMVDASLDHGFVGFYCWGNENSRFYDIEYATQAGLNDADLGPRVTDQGNVAAPSSWHTEGGVLVQSSNIYSMPQDRDALPMLGTYLSVGDTSWADYAIESYLTSADDDAIGLMFRVRDVNNYYRLSMDLQRSYIRLVRCEAGQFTLLWQIDRGFNGILTSNRIRIVADGSRLRGYLDYQRLFDLRDRTHLDGGIAFYCWGSEGARFYETTVRQIRPRGLMERLNAGELGVSIPAGAGLDLPTLSQTFLSEADAEATVSAKVLERLSAAPEHCSARDGLEPIVLGPQLPMPLSTRLIAMAPQLLLPGLEEVPDNAVVLLEPDPAFIAAFMVGANHEMTRELLWRGLATDPRATVFRQFWDVRGGQYGAETEAQREAHKDIAPIHQWPATSLASQVGAAGSYAIFLVRSEMIRRFPQASYFLIQAEPDGLGGRKPGLTTQPYLFRGHLGDDMAFFGFDLTVDEVRGSGAVGDLGWYFTIEQPPTGTRFGLDIGGQAGAALSTWADLAWNHIDAGANLDADNLNAVPPASGPTWGQNGAHMAAITLQKPVRILIHAERLLGAAGASGPPPPPES